MLIVFTSEGQIIICRDSGEFKSVLHDSPTGVNIVSCATHNRGFIVGGACGEIIVFNKQDDMENPFRLDKKFVNTIEKATIEKAAITSLAINSTEDVFFITANNLLRKLVNALEITDEDLKVQDVICDFHSAKITGLDICIRKPLIVTCSEDRTIRVWNYLNRTLDISKVQTEECLAVAFHPSGFHIVVALQDKI